MSQEAILEKVRSIVAEQLSVDAGEVKPESNFQNDLGADSLDTVELVMALEEAFDIEIPDEAKVIRVVMLKVLKSMPELKTFRKLPTNIREMNMARSKA